MVTSQQQLQMQMQMQMQQLEQQQHSPVRLWSLHYQIINHGCLGCTRQSNLFMILFKAPQQTPTSPLQLLMNP